MAAGLRSAGKWQRCVFFFQAYAAFSLFAFQQSSGRSEISDSVSVVG